ncbi:MAG: hypothetical protein HQ501_07755 [Rhodospirillales bacterium]|nr:hypothetical protein [Rhodospirillales bacterium]
MDNRAESLSGGIKIDPSMMVLSGKDLMEESSKMPVQEFNAGHGVKIVRQGMMVKIEGGENLSPQATMAALQASKMGGEAGRAMFNTYYKNNPAEFDGSKTFDAIMKKAHAPQPPATDPSSRAETAQGTGLFARGGNGAKLEGTPAGDFLEALQKSNLYGGEGDDTLTAGNDSKLYGGAGNDILSSTDRGTLNGGEGDDTLSAYNTSTLFGGNGNDRLSAYHGSSFDGGEGDDSISGYNNAHVVDEQGDNHVSAYRDATVTTGNGGDWIDAYSGATIRAGNGNNMVTTYGDSSVISGDNADMIEVGVNSQVISGGGDDLITAGSDSIINAGAGDDRVTLKGDSTYHFARGDGNDIIGGGTWGAAYRETDNLSSSVVAFGQGITVSDLSFEGQGNDLVVSIGPEFGQGDSLRLRDYQRHGIPSMTFEDGTTMSSEDITNIVGTGEPYRPVSQLMQSFHDAAIAYQTANAEKTKGAA